MSHRSIKSNAYSNHRDQKSSFEKHPVEKTYVCDYCKKLGHLAKFCYALGYKNCTECKSKGFKSCVCSKESRNDYNNYAYLSSYSNGLNPENSGEIHRRNDDKTSKGNGFYRRERSEGGKRGRMGGRERDRRDASPDSRRKSRHDDSVRRGSYDRIGGDSDHEAWDDDGRGHHFHRTLERAEGDHENGRKRGRSVSKERTSRLSKDSHDEKSHDHHGKENGSEHARSSAHSRGSERNSMHGSRGRGKSASKNSSRSDRDHERSRLSSHHHSREPSGRSNDRSGSWHARNDHLHSNGHRDHHYSGHHQHHRESNWHEKSDQYLRDKRWVESMDRGDHREGKKGYSTDEIHEMKYKETANWDKWFGNRDLVTEKVNQDEFLEANSRVNYNVDESNLEMGEIVESPVKVAVLDNHSFHRDHQLQNKNTRDHDVPFTDSDFVRKKHLDDEKKNTEVVTEEDEREEGELRLEEEKVKEEKVKEEEEEEEEEEKEEEKDKMPRSIVIKDGSDTEPPKEIEHTNQENDYAYIMTHFRHKKFNYNQELKHRKMNEENKPALKNPDESSKFTRKSDENENDTSTAEMENPTGSCLVENSDAWYYNDALGNLQGPLLFSELKKFHDEDKLESDHMIRKGNSNSWKTLSNVLQTELTTKEPLDFNNPMDKNSFVPLSEVLSVERDETFNRSEPELILEHGDTGLEGIESKPNLEGEKGNTHTEELQVEATMEEPRILLSVDERVKNLMRGFELSEDDLKKDEKEVEILMLEAVKAAIRRAAQAMKDEDERIETYLKQRARINASKEKEAEDLNETKEQLSNHDVQLDSFHLKSIPSSEINSISTENLDTSNLLNDESIATKSNIAQEDKLPAQTSIENQASNVDTESLRPKNTVTITIPHTEETEETKMKILLSKYKLNFLHGGDWKMIFDPFLQPPGIHRLECYRQVLNQGEPLWSKFMVKDSQRDPRLDPSLNPPHDSTNESKQPFLLELPKWATYWPQGFGSLTEEMGNFVQKEKEQQMEPKSAKIKTEPETEVKMDENSEVKVEPDSISLSTEHKHVPSGSVLSQNKTTTSSTKRENNFFDGMEENEANAIKILSQGLSIHEDKSLGIKTAREFKNVSLGVLRPSKVSGLVKDQTFPEIYSVVRRNALYMKTIQKPENSSEENADDSKIEKILDDEKKESSAIQDLNPTSLKNSEKDRSILKTDQGASNGFAAHDWYAYDEDEEYDEYYYPPSVDKKNQKSVDETSTVDQKIQVNFSSSPKPPVRTLYYTSPPARVEKDRKDLAEKDSKGKEKVEYQPNQSQPFTSLPPNYLFHGRRVMTVDGNPPSLPITDGEWCYLDEMGAEKGHLPYWKMQSLVKSGQIEEGSSIYRKEDNLWVPASLPHPLFDSITKISDRTPTGNKYYAKYRSNYDLQLKLLPQLNTPYHPFSKVSNQKFLYSSLPPSLLSYIYGKLHERIMHSFRSKIFKASIGEVLDGWIKTNSFRSLDIVNTRLLSDPNEVKEVEKEEEKEVDGYIGGKKDGESSSFYPPFSSYKGLNALKPFKTSVKGQFYAQNKNHFTKSKSGLEKDLNFSDEDELSLEIESKKSIKRSKSYMEPKKNAYGGIKKQFANENETHESNEFDDMDDDDGYSPSKTRRSNLSLRMKTVQNKSAGYVKDKSESKIEGDFSEPFLTSPTSSCSSFDSHNQIFDSNNHHPILSNPFMEDESKRDNLLSMKESLRKAEEWFEKVLEEEKSRMNMSKNEEIEKAMAQSIMDTCEERSKLEMKRDLVFDIITERCNGDVLLMSSSILVCKKWNEVVRKYKKKDKKVNFSTVRLKCSNEAVDSWILKNDDYQSLEKISFRNCIQVSVDCVNALIKCRPSISWIDISGCPALKDLISSFPSIKFVYKHKQPSFTPSRLKRRHDRLALGISHQSRNLTNTFSDFRASWGATGNRKFKRIKFSEINSQRLLSVIHGFDNFANTYSVGMNEEEDADDGKSIDIVSEVQSDSKIDQNKSTPTSMLTSHWKKTKKLKKSNHLIGNKRKIIQEKKYFNNLKRSKSEDSQSKECYSSGKELQRNGNIKGRKAQYYWSGSDDRSPTNSDTSDSDSYHSRPRPINNHERKSMMPDSDSDDGFSIRGKPYSDTSVVKNKKKEEEFKELNLKDAEEEENGYAEEDEYDSDNLEKIRSKSRKNWGNRMTQQSMVPPVTRTYESIEEYVIVTDKEDVERKMTAQLPNNFDALMENMRKQGMDEIQMHLDLPQVKEAKPRKLLGIEVIEQEVYGIDPYTHNLLLDSMPTDLPYFTRESERHAFIEDQLLTALNDEAREKFPIGKAPMSIDLIDIVNKIRVKAMEEGNLFLQNFCNSLHSNMILRSNRKGKDKDSFLAYRKGLGVVCAANNGIEADDFVVEFFGEVYPPWRWFEKQDGIRKWQNREPITEFYNIILERPRGDALGFDVLVVDAMHKANYASRLCHSCRPNCEAKVAAINGKYMIGVFSIRPIKHGEELTFNYMSVTENIEEFNQAVCLCGNRYCKGSYLDLGGASAFQQAISEQHGILTRYKMLVDSFSAQTSLSPSSPSSPSLAPPSSLTEEEQHIFQSIGFSSCLFKDLPPWMIKYIAQLAKFITWERQVLPEMLLNQNNIKKKSRKSTTSAIYHDNPSTLEQAKEEAEGVFLQRMQSIAITVDKVRYYLRSTFPNPSTAPPPLLRLDEKELVNLIWSNENSVVCSLLKCLASSMDKVEYTNFRRKVLHYNKPGVEGRSLKDCLIWLRDELLHMECSGSSRHDAAADLIHLYAYTKYFFKQTDYPSVASPPIKILPSDLGRTLPDNGGPDAESAKKIPDFTKTYDRDFVLGQLLFWFKQSLPEPGRTLSSAMRGCLVLPEPSSCYSRNPNQPLQRSYGVQQRNSMIDKMISKAQKSWPKPGDDWIWEWKNARSFYGSPMLDAVLENRYLDPEMMEWLKTRPIHFIGPFDLP